MSKVQEAICKFYCGSVEKFDHGAATVRMRTEYDADMCEDDRAFSDATPNGEMEVDIRNPALDGFFVPGKRYLITITPAD